MENYLLISDAAKEVRVESHVLRYWEDELHLPIKRNELGHRYYTAEDVERFKQIKGMKERGLQLKAIKMILRDGKLDVLPTEDMGAARTGQREDMGQSTTETESWHGRQDGGANRGMGTAWQGSTGQNTQDRDTAGRMYQDAMGRNLTEGVGAVSDSRDRITGHMAIDIIPNKNMRQEVSQESREDKSRRLQWLLQELSRQTLQENNKELCQEIRESVVKELDYQFRMQEEREEARDKMLAERDEEHFKKMDEILRKKAKRPGKVKKEKIPKNQTTEEGVEELPEEGQKVVPEKKKRRFL